MFKFRRWTFFLLLPFLLFAGTLVSQEALDWIGSYSSDEYEYSEKSDSQPEKIYYQWQIDSLKKAIPPRYIRLLDIKEYTHSGQLLNKGVLFTFAGLRNQKVEICGSMLNWKCRSMIRNRFGVYYILIQPEEIEKIHGRSDQYLYKYKVDGLYETDPENPELSEDESGSAISIYYTTPADVNRYATVEVLDDSEDEEPGLRTLVFQIFQPEAETIAIAGSFNNWQYDTDYLTRNENGIFELKKKLLPGTYHYYFIVDGEPVADKFNPNVKVREPFGELVSEIQVKERSYQLERKF
jgi:hypothetical protein